MAQEIEVLMDIIQRSDSYDLLLINVLCGIEGVFTETEEDGLCADADV